MPQSGSTTHIALFIRNLQCCRCPRLSTWLMACEGLAWQSMDPEPSGESARTRCWKVHRAYLLHTTGQCMQTSCSPVHVVMVHQSLPSYDNLSLCMQRKPFLHASAPQIESLRPKKWQWWLPLSSSIRLTYFIIFVGVGAVIYNVMLYNVI